MDSRFVRIWEDVALRRAQGEPLGDVLDRMGMDELIALLAAVPKTEPVVANVVATTLLNRVRRLRATTGLLVGLTLGVALYVTDGIYTGEWLDLEGRPFAIAVAVLALGIIVAALVALFLVQRDQLRGRQSDF